MGPGMVACPLILVELIHRFSLIMILLKYYFCTYNTMRTGNFQEKHLTHEFKMLVQRQKFLEFSQVLSAMNLRSY